MAATAQSHGRNGDRIELRSPRQRQPSTSGRWAWKVGRVFGIDIFVHVTFLLLLGWVAFTHLAGGFSAVWRGLALVIAVFVLVVLHELGHALVAKRFGVPTSDITLLPIGGVSRLERMPEKPIEELLVAVAGPAVNVALALSLWAFLTIAGRTIDASGLAVVGGSFLVKLLFINVSLALFNLLPAFPMDGGRVLRAVLALRFDYVHATEIAARLGRGLAVLLGVVGVVVNPMLVVIAVFVWMGAQQESTTVALKRALGGVPVGSAMVTEFRPLAPTDTLADAARLIVGGAQHNFPVLEEGRIVGVLTRGDVVRGLASDGPDASVASAMHRQFVAVQPTDLLDSVLTRLQLPDAMPLIVMRGDIVLGLLTTESLGEFILLQGARQGGHVDATRG